MNYGFTDGDLRYIARCMGNAIEDSNLLVVLPAKLETAISFALTFLRQAPFGVIKILSLALTLMFSSNPEH
jgi:hypothetical protein